MSNQNYGYNSPDGPYMANGVTLSPHDNYRAAVPNMPSAGELGGKTPGVPPWYRQGFYPTAPFYSTDPMVGYQTRFYSGGVVNLPINIEQIVTVQFDIPCRLIAINGGAFNTNTLLPVSNDNYLFRLEYTTGDKLHTAARLGTTVVGSAERPGEIGGAGYTIDQGASVILGITPLVQNLRIDITLVCLEMRGPRNFQRG
jgi:hypothetical protein